MLYSVRTLAVFLLLVLHRSQGGSKPRSNGPVVVAGATGYIGRAVVRELVKRKVPTYSLVRSQSSMSEITRACLQGSNIIECNPLDPSDVDKTMLLLRPSSIINCLASRNGLPADSWAVDYGGGVNLLKSLLVLNQNTVTEGPPQSSCHYVMLSAFCCGKPELQFQFAKLKLEEELQRATGSHLTHSIVRPTAYFKSLDGQLEAAKKGKPILYFGSGSCAANAISEEDLAIFLVECALNPGQIGMLNTMRNIGGPDVPPTSKLEQIELIFDALDIPQEKRKTVSIPVGVFQILISLFSFLGRTTEAVGLKDVAQKCEDATEIIRIVRYYATEPMVAVGEGEVQGRVRLADHFCTIAGRGGCLLEIDQYTTTTGVLDMVLKNDYVK